MSKERYYELTRNQLAAHINYDAACEIADARYGGDKQREEKAIQEEIPSKYQGKVRRILARIEEIRNGHSQA